MATLILSTVGAAAGNALAPGGISLFGGNITGAMLGRAAGALAGSLIDSALTSSSGQTRIVEGPRLSNLKVSASTEGTPIPRLYGRARLAGQLIWATQFEEQIIRTTQTSGGGGGGGKGFGGGGGGGGSQTVTQVEYRYFANVAYGLCEGKITGIGRIWADGKELNQSQYSFRIHKGADNQPADSLIAAKQGGLAPAYRGTAYIVFERMPLARFGNRLPQLNFEIFRAVDQFENTVRAINIIPSAGEFVYSTQKVMRDAGSGTSVAENAHSSLGSSDWQVAIDQLSSQLPKTENASLIVSWFGTDLRMGECHLRPGVELTSKATTPIQWRVADLARSAAHLVSRHYDHPAYGGTPSDDTVIGAIKDLRARGITVTFNPFILMDVAADNDLPNPYNSGASNQPAYPWRGRITLDPAPGEPNSPDKTPAAGAQVDAFMGTASASHFSWDGTAVQYNGPDEWRYRRMILHYATLCQAAGGVESFLIGSELRGMTWARDGAASYPFVQALIELAHEVRQIVGAGCKIFYAADWSEYFGHHPRDGSGDVYFHLDPLWADNNIDAIGIDCYWPLSDWRDGDAHLDRQQGAKSIYELDYLRSNISGGEGYDWYYATEQDRITQSRTAITDGTYHKPWVFRYKDIRSWWENMHYNRPGGVEVGSATPWVPKSKPIWFNELGCPAIDKGANQPNVFVDPKSSESHIPYFSRKLRDDLIQRRYIQAFYDYYDPTHEEYIGGSNPVSPVYGGHMVALSRIYVYAWDARPYPAFPYAHNIWADAGNWEYGHWLSGRLGAGPLAAVVASIFEDFGFTRFSVAGLIGEMDGYVIDRIMSARQAIQSLELGFFFDGYESSGIIQFAHRGRNGSPALITKDDLVDGDDALFTITRRQETELPRSVKLLYHDGNTDYRQAVAEARRVTARSSRTSVAELSIVTNQVRAQQQAEAWLHDSWSAREQARFTLPPSRLAIEPTDSVILRTERDTPLRITRTNEGNSKQIEALSVDANAFSGSPAPQRQQALQQQAHYGTPRAVFLDLPLVRGDEAAHVGYVAAQQRPWPGAVTFLRSAEDSGFTVAAHCTAPAIIGTTINALSAGPVGRYDRANQLTVRLNEGELQSVSDLALLGGANAAAVETQPGQWEILQFRDAELIDANSYRLSFLLRGQQGSDELMADSLPPGATFVMLDGGVTPINMGPDEIGLEYRWRFGPISRSLDDISYGAAQHAFSGRALRPLSPSHARASRLPDGDIEIHWIRRTRAGGDSWQGIDVPLAEEEEQYDVEIIDGETLIRRVTSDQPFIRYALTQQLEDFGVPATNFEARIFQLSRAYGRGAAATMVYS